jgi:hypothetical protein
MKKYRKETATPKKKTATPRKKTPQKKTKDVVSIQAMDEAYPPSKRVPVCVGIANATLL